MRDLCVRRCSRMCPCCALLLVSYVCMFGWMFVSWCALSSDSSKLGVFLYQMTHTHTHTPIMLLGHRPLIWLPETMCSCAYVRQMSTCTCGGFSVCTFIHLMILQIINVPVCLPSSSSPKKYRLAYEKERNFCQNERNRWRRKILKARWKQEQLIMLAVWIQPPHIQSGGIFTSSRVISQAVKKPFDWVR